MAYILLCGFIGVIFTLQLYSLSLFDKKPEPPIVERHGDMLITGLESRYVTVGNLDASAAKIENVVAPPLIITDITKDDLGIDDYVRLYADGKVYTTFRRRSDEIFS
jgi:hypothetical protein